jgi:DNA-binding PadR family transcriptional regulator
MPVKHALLALLAERDLTGYELKLRFERVLGEFWQLNSGQVYSTLERLRRAGMVARRNPRATLTATAAVADEPASSGDESSARAAFSIRPRGRHALAEWMAAPIGRLRPVRDPLFVKLAFSEPEHVARMLRAFAQETRRYREAAETLRALVAREPMSHGGRVRWLVAEAARRSYEAQLGWLECVQQMLAPSPAPRRAGPRPLRERTLAEPEERGAVA